MKQSHNKKVAIFPLLFMASTLSCFSANVGNFVWNDQNKNGIQDANETGISQVYIKLKQDGTNKTIQRTKTDANGKFLFTNVPAGKYYIRAYTPTGYASPTPRYKGTDKSKDSDLKTTGKTTKFKIKTNDNLNLDIGFVKKAQPTIKKYSVGNLVWIDSNKNGAQDNGENGLANVTIKLSKANQEINTTKSSQVGQYLFSNLTAGNYCVQINMPAGYKLTAGVTKSCFTLNANKSNVDFGLEKNITPPAGNVASIGDFVWNDVNNNGVQDANESGIPNVYVKLRNGTTNRKVQATRTDANGKYLFSNIAAGKYYIQYYLPTGYKVSSPRDKGGDDTKDSDGGSTGKTVKFNLTTGNQLNFDMGFNKGTTTPPVTGVGSVGDKVWYDKNKNGIQDAGEKGIQNKMVRLYSSNGRKLQSIRTDKNGNFLFANVPAGQYYIRFVIPKVYKASPLNQGTDTTKDSDGGATGKTANFTVTANAKLDIDMGLTR